MQAETAQSHRWAGVHGPDVQPDVPRAPQPCTVPAQKELGLVQISHLPGEGGRGNPPLSQRLSAEFFQLHEPVVIAANTASHFGSLASLKCKTSPTQTFFFEQGKHSLSN